MMTTINRWITAACTAVLLGAAVVAGTIWGAQRWADTHLLSPAESSRLSGVPVGPLPGGAPGVAPAPGVTPGPAVQPPAGAATTPGPSDLLGPAPPPGARRAGMWSLGPWGRAPRLLVSSDGVPRDVLAGAVLGGSR